MAVSKAEGGLVGLMSCVASPPDIPDAEEQHHEPKKRRFHPLRGLRRIFRRKERRAPQQQQQVTVSADELSPTGPADDPRRGSGVLHCGLSLSHDSVFSPEQRGPESGSELDTSSSLSMQRLLPVSHHQAELVDAVRRRRVRDDTSDDEDLGLPRSPPSHSPSDVLVLDKVLKENVNKSNHSTCSDGSLLSMGSSEMDEDSFGQSSGHGSKLSLHDKKSVGEGMIVGGGEGEVEVTSAPLSHSAARHKMAIKPKRTHGVPRKRRSTQLTAVTTLPATPEVNEEANSIVSAVAVGRSVTPDLPQASGTASTVQLKSASLPLGTAPPRAQSPVKLSRSKSSATNKPLDAPAESEEPELKNDTTFFGRLLSRRSGKKKKVVEEPPLDLPQKRMDEKGRYVHEVTKLGRHHPASRQRVEPINISQERISRMQVFYPPSPPPPDSPPFNRNDVEPISDENTLEGRSALKKVVPLEVDSSIPKRTFVKKSQSFRRDEALPFVSLDTPSLPTGLGVDLQNDYIEDLNELTTLEVIDHHLSSERLHDSSKDKIKTTIKINSLEKLNSFEVVVSKEDVTDHKTEPSVLKSLSLDNVHGCVTGLENKNTVSSESINHQITIPVGSAIVNITQTNGEPRQGSPPHNIKPEPRKSIKEGSKDVPNFYPVPAPRPSKRDSLEGKPPRVPEFLRVQLNHVDNKPSVNVVLSTGSSLEEKKLDSFDTFNDFEKDATMENEFMYQKSNKANEIDVKAEISQENIFDNTKVTEKCVAKDPIDPNQVKFLNSVKQWCAPPYAVSNPNYSIVSIAPKSLDTNKSDKPCILSNQSLPKNVAIKEMREKSPPLIEKIQEMSPVKAVLRQRSFVNDEKSSNILNNDKSFKADDYKPIPQKKPAIKEIFMSDIDRSRKLSLDRLDSRNHENISDFSKRRSRDISSSEDNIVDGNSFSSSDTLASQDSGDVVLRRKSLSRDIIKQKEEEPELLKVFARRSLKLKDTEGLEDLETSSYPPVKSRDSDKENECGDSPPEERKKIKEHLTESKVLEKTVPGIMYKYQRSVSSTIEDAVIPSVLSNSKKDNNAFEKRQRSRTIPEPKVVDPPIPAIANKPAMNIFTEKEVEVISLENLDESTHHKEENVPRFKRIQQRKEEWEKRAQLAMKKTHP